MTYNVFGGTLNLAELQQIRVHFIHKSHMRLRCVGVRRSNELSDADYPVNYSCFCCCCCCCYTTIGAASVMSIWSCLFTIISRCECNCKLLNTVYFLLVMIYIHLRIMTNCMLYNCLEWYK